MGTLTVHDHGRERDIPFQGTPLVAEVLERGGLLFPHPCGRKGKCKKCALSIVGTLSACTPVEEEAGVRLSCQTRLLGDAVAELSESARPLAGIQSEGIMPSFTLHPMSSGYGIALDIGTTTLALRLIDLENGAFLGEATGENPQRSVAADVIGRMEAALAGQEDQLQTLLLNAVEAHITTLLRVAGLQRKDIKMLVAAGNTTMLYLLTRRSPLALSMVPFEADCLFDTTITELGIPMYLPRCFSAFVGADITCALIASGMCRQEETALLVDIGTNGEIALWHRGVLLAGSTAAGPVFEGSGIHFGMGSVNGAIDRVFLEDGQIRVTTIGNAPAIGICGSGLIDAVAVFLQRGDIDETGFVESERLWLTDVIYVTRQDVRNVQLAKGAIAAGIETLLQEAGLAADHVAALYISGGFGSHINLHSAAAIGLIPAAWAGRATVIGNGALTGCSMLLLNTEFLEDTRQIAGRARSLNFGGNSGFAAHYMDNMLFAST